MSTLSDRIEDLEALNRISLTLNQAVDVRSALENSLRQLVDLMGLETGWIFLYSPSAVNRWHGRGYELVASYQLPPALALGSSLAWNKGCDCQAFCQKGQLKEAYNEIRCSRLAEAEGDRKGLLVHASTPLRSGSRVLGILNVAAPDWGAFDQRILTMLTSVGLQMGVALERAQLHDMLSERWLQEQSALLLLSQKLLKRSSLEGLESFIVDEARKLLNLDACALLLPDPEDEEQLYILAESGWETNPVAAKRRVPADEHTRVGRTFLSQKPLVASLPTDLPETALDHWALAEKFKVLASVPLIIDDHSIGVLVAHSREEREFEESDLRFLQLLANQAAIALEAWRLRNEELEWARTERELAFGRVVQKSMLPDNHPSVSGWVFAFSYEAAREVGGDFYDFFPFVERPELWSIVIADVSDKGVPAALYMVLSRTTIRNTVRVDRPPATVLEKTNRYILQDSQADMFLSAFYATLDTDTGSLTFANAGHNHPLWWQAETGQLVPLSQHGILLGVVDDVQLDDYHIDVGVGDLLIFYTDGITEAVDDKEQEFGEVRLMKVVADTLQDDPEIDSEALVAIILHHVNSFTCDQPQFDDRTLIVVKRTNSQDDR